jgi:hypothetical protein
VQIPPILYPEGMTTTLKTSKDRKVANGVSANGTQALISNTFGLASGKAYSCPGETNVCGSICYSGALENLFPAVATNMLHNFNTLKDCTTDEMHALLYPMIWEFEAASNRRHLPLIYRIHWDGDFFNTRYISAWLRVINAFPNIQFWVYTRNATAAVAIHKNAATNVSLYFSTDNHNKTIGEMLKRVYGIRLAYLADTFSEAQAQLKEITGKPGARCPEQTKQIPMISEKGSACNVCGLCVFGKADIAFSISKK